MVYNPDLFDADRIDALLADLADLVGALAADAARAGRRGRRRAAPAHRAGAALGAMTVAGAATAGPPRRCPTGPDELTETEELIAGIWREVLERDRVGVTDNFFDIGGHSLALAAVHARLTAATGRSIRDARPVPPPHRPGARRQPGRRRRPAGAGPRRAAGRRPPRPDPPYPTAPPWRHRVTQPTA